MMLNLFPKVHTKKSISKFTIKSISQKTSKFHKQYNLRQNPLKRLLFKQTSSNLYSKSSKVHHHVFQRKRFLRIWTQAQNQPSSLMDFPEIVWPSVLKSLNNAFISKLIINQYLDNDFNLAEFVRGAKRALQVVSTKLSSQDFDGLQKENLVTRDIIPLLKQSTSKLTQSQRTKLKIVEPDLFFTFPYEVGMMVHDAPTGQTRIVEITMVYHALRNLKELVQRGERIPLVKKLPPEYQRRLSICNYRFRREFTKGVKDDWTINLLNHFVPDKYYE